MLNFGVWKPRVKGGWAPGPPTRLAPEIPSENLYVWDKIVAACIEIVRFTKSDILISDSGKPTYSPRSNFPSKFVNNCFHLL